MGAPKGNKNAAGSSYDIEAEAKALDEWSKRADALALCGFCVERDIYAQRVYEWRDESPLFAEILKKAKMRIAHRQRLLLNKNEYNYGLFMREIHHHDKFLNDAETDEKDADARRGKEIAESASEGFKQALASTVDMIAESRQSLRERKIDESKSSNDK